MSLNMRSAVSFIDLYVHIFIYIYICARACAHDI